MAPQYEERFVWHVKVDGDIYIEAADQAQAIERAQEQFVAGEGSLAFGAELHKVLIEPGTP